MFRNSGYKIGRFLGIDVFIHSSFLIMYFFLTLSLGSLFEEQHAIAAPLHWFLGAILTVIVYITLIAHEYGHAMAARYYKIGTAKITLFLLGGVAEIKEEPHSAFEEFIIAIAGPAVSFICAVVFGALAALFYFLEIGEIIAAIAFYVSMANVAFVVFNMLPGFPMDGGRVLRSFIWGVTDNYLLATRIASLCGRGFSMLLIFLGVMRLFAGDFGGLLYIAMGLFLNWAAKSAYQMSFMKVAFENLKVRDVMRPVQVVVPANTSIKDVVKNYIYRIHGDLFPVVDGERLLGRVSASSINSLRRDDWAWTSASQIAQPYSDRERIGRDQSALAAYEFMRAFRMPNLAVFRDNRLVGFVYLKDIVHHIENLGKSAGSKRTAFRRIID